ncbi:MAG: hypothetical protein KDA66_05175, partial [Planctomycetaceae bacterium]|nr:hypothetical protein [Planctomycetaceae bacterium]
MWTAKGWVVLVISDSDYDPEPFMEAYLTAIAGEEVELWDEDPVAIPEEMPAEESIPGEEQAPQELDSLDSTTKPAFKPGKEEEAVPAEEVVPAE